MEIFKSSIENNVQHVNNCVQSTHNMITKIQQLNENLSKIDTIAFQIKVIYIKKILIKICL
jgi:hypothetical protein